MKIAYFSPLLPKKTGIATYSQHLGVALNELMEVHLFDIEVPYKVLDGMPVNDFSADPQVLTKLYDYDVCLYHLGNNPWFHLEIYKVFLRHPGVVVLHDTILYYLIAGMNREGFVKEFCINYGVSRLEEFRALIAESPDGDVLRYQFPERYPFLKRTFARAAAIVVHSDTSRRWVQEAGYTGPVHVIDLLSYPGQKELVKGVHIQRLKEKYNIAKDEIIIGCCGFIGRTKQLDVVTDALSLLKDKLSFRLLIVGEGDDSSLHERLREKQIQNKVVWTGFVNDADFNHHLTLIDIVVNLRYPSMGEASVTVIQAFSHNKACIVTNNAWFSELPDDCVCKVGFELNAPEEVARAIWELAQDPVKRKQMGNNARNYMETRCLPTIIARRYLKVIEGVAGGSVREHEKQEDQNREWVTHYLLHRTADAIPQ